MAADALALAFAEAQCDWQDIDLLIYASGTHHQALPYDAAGLLHHISCPHPVASFDINSTCLSFLTALDMAQAAIVAGRYQRIAIVSSELASPTTRHQEPEVSTLFADGAAAFIIEAAPERKGLQAIKFETHSYGYEYCQIRAGGSALNTRDTSYDALVRASQFDMQGKTLFRQAARLLPTFVSQTLRSAELSMAEIDAVIPHQASFLALARLPKLLQLESEKICNHVSWLGNQVSASIPTVLHLQRQAYGDNARGKKLLLLGTAAGLSLGMGVLTL
uniref:3-oxoacyl-[acyl-carrier-protein] synthase III C-terminal domain-containing protein n=1 Tax=Thaumasiovibrio occultus TaxID=1891184 RepID=UPI000B35F59F|nr:3-oxoacyl-[acyl-carrier-protein] synthase III C-terminal domain-containing protein [Thaumasiovibrio occultus]